MRFSIIVPIYKVENYLTECIESVLAQDYFDYELILVDDGSPDNCPGICDEYAARDSRVRVIHKKNGGLSAARNTGIQHANGEYLLFLDGDDCLFENVLSELNNCIESNNAPEMIIGNIIYWDGTHEQLHVNNQRYVDLQEVRTLSSLNEMFAADGAMLPWSACQSIYKRCFLAEYHLLFTENLIGAEDFEFYLRVIKHVRTYKLTAIPFIRYRIHRDGSITTTPSYASVYDRLHIFAHAYSNASDFENTALMRTYFANWYTNIVILVNQLEKPEDRASCYAYIQEHKDIIRHTSKRSKYIVARTVWGIFGFRRGSDVLLIIKKVFHL